MSGIYTLAILVWKCRKICYKSRTTSATGFSSLIISQRQTVYLEIIGSEHFEEKLYQYIRGIGVRLIEVKYLKMMKDIVLIACVVVCVRFYPVGGSPPTPFEVPQSDCQESDNKDSDNEDSLTLTRWFSGSKLNIL